MGDIARLERQVRDMNQRLQNALARMRRTGFGPGAFNFTDNISSALYPTRLHSDTGAIANEYLTAFPGSVVALSVISAATYAGTSSSYFDFEVYVNGVATGVTVRIAGGERYKSVYVRKSDYALAANDIIQVAVNGAGSALGSLTGHTATVWVSFT